MRLFVFLMLLVAGSLARAQGLDYPSVWQCDSQKTNWYCDDPPAQEKPAQKPQPAPKKQLGAVSLASLKTAEQLRQELKRREDIAVMEPTPANVQAYIEAWQLAQEKGAIFADTWRRVVWQNPNLDYSTRRPVNNSALKTWEDTRSSNQDDQLRKLAKDHGLIFFFRSDCPYCHAMAPTVIELSQRYGIEILPVSIDGKPLPGFATFIDGRTSAAKWGINTVPALFIGSKQNGDKAAIGFGQLSLSEITSRIFVLTGTKPGSSF